MGVGRFPDLLRSTAMWMIDAQASQAGVCSWSRESSNVSLCATMRCQSLYSVKTVPQPLISLMLSRAVIELWLLYVAHKWSPSYGIAHRAKVP